MIPSHDSWQRFTGMADATDRACHHPGKKKRICLRVTEVRYIVWHHVTHGNHVLAYIGR